ncbi:hypothetical protein GS456_25555 [Rhodococcus hoagii]|nr:hypothetical protein [Prescottella equi]MBM4478556.1 hypothetical protein [Prescottella equi]NKT14177.1 hypothetical protein [Prescottella equi]NKW44958.1 hypothetical protein [Prescottella equi]
MRALKVLATCFGLVLGLLTLAVVTLVEWVWLSEPVRTNSAYVGDYSYGSVSVAVDRSWMLVALMYPVVGAVLGWLSAVAAIRFGWKLTRGDS